MYKKVFFSFHYENDVRRANVVRNSGVFRSIQEAGFIDKAEFEKIKRTGESAVKRWIDQQLKGTSVTVVLLGEETLNRPYVRYEIEESYRKGNTIIGVKIGNVRDMVTGLKSVNPSTAKIIGTDTLGKSLNFNEITSGIYDYINDDGYNNLGKWIAKASV